MLGVVADGMGGLQHGSQASAIAVKQFFAAYERKQPEDSIPGALSAAVAAANRAVNAFALERNCEGKTATTIVAAVICGEELYWISAGDSRAYLIRRGLLFQLTCDHTCGVEHDRRVARGEDVEPIEPEQREAVTSFLGLRDAPKTDANVRPYLLRPDDCILLCTDGLYRTLTEAEISACVGRDYQASCAKLIEEARSHGLPDQDNMTAVLLGKAAAYRDWGFGQLSGWLLTAIAVVAFIVVAVLICLPFWT